MERISNKLHHQGALTMIIMGVIFAGLALKLEKVGPKSNFKCFVSNFNPCPSSPFVEKDDRKQSQCPNIV